MGILNKINKWRGFYSDNEIKCKDNDKVIKYFIEFTEDDEYQEYITDTDANFYSQSREAKCINIISIKF